ncbi:hypothetical protein QNI19_28745 [Cytophagaceae bacterium DM2B3-1]|uniref:Uncharacterized protein n=1 Tax=Xanthocytophaga flava TaxID=3048013 RepID=A0ABT7CWH9_9BACT|nr:hypothetical protein [Xanthocytophaga flavus]MDJ1472175.1 hypothetical protein [Xanthocytophaga flavus]MDJ1496959.1 hypothetical protein [Xanthocytophaga flavus]
MKPLVTIVSFLFLLPAYAQDVIYQSDESALKCKLIEVSDKRVKYKSLQNLKGPDRVLEPDEILMVFSESGNYIVFPVDASYAAGAMPSVATATPRNFDIIITKDQQVIKSSIGDNNSESLQFKNLLTGQTQTLEKSKLVVILYKDGKHELLITPNDAAPVLKSVKKQVDGLFTEKSVPVEKERVATNTSSVNQTVVSTKNNTNEKATGGGPTVASGNTAQSGNTPAKDTYGLSPEQFEEFKNKALVKTDEFTVNLQIITDVNTSREKANKTIDLTTGLFVNEDARVEVSNINTGVKNKYKIRGYLDRLLTRSSQYSKVELEFADISYASEFRKGQDGNYYAVISFVQTFKGFKDDVMVYGDVTERNATVILKLYDKDEEGVTKKVWDVFLADVGVVETRKQ